MGISVADFGAVGDGHADDTAALQAGINAAQARGRALLVPAGTYITSKMLLIRPDSKGNLTSLRLVGEGPHHSKIVGSTDLVADAIISIEGSQATKHHLEGIMVWAAGSQTQFAVLAPLLTRSKFSFIKFYGGAVGGLKLGGWINSIVDCEFVFNQGVAALMIEGQANAIDVVRCSFEGNRGAGILVNGGVNVRIDSNTIEGNGGPGVVANAVQALSLRSNYFEANLRGPINTPVSSAAAMWPISGAMAAAAGIQQYNELAICADVIVNGANASTFTLDAPELSDVMPCQGVLLSGNSHCVDAVRCVKPDQNLSHTVVAGVLLASAEGVVMQANSAGGCREHYPTQRCVAVVGGNRSGVSLDMNIGWTSDFSSWDLLGSNRTTGNDTSQTSVIARAPQQFVRAKTDDNMLDGNVDEQLITPENGFLDVTKAPFNVDNTGKAVTDAALQKAVSYAYFNHLVAYFPHGEYLLEKAINALENLGPATMVPGNSFGAFQAGRWLPNVFLGARAIVSKEGAVTRPTFVLKENANLTGALVNFVAGEPDINYNQIFRGIDIRIMDGNPAANGINMAGAQGTSMQDVTVWAGNGYAGT